MTRTTSYAGPAFLSDDFYKDPFVFYEYLQRNHPIHWAPEINSWIVTRYEDIMAGLKNPHFSAARGNSYFGMLKPEEQQELEPLQNFFSKWLLFSDGDFHIRLRQILAKSSFFKSNAEHRDKMETQANALLQPFLKDEKGEIGIMSDYAIPLSISVICKILGIDESDFKQVFQWNMNIVGFMGSGKPDITLGRRALDSYHELCSYAEKLLAKEDYEIGETLLGDLVIYTQRGELTMEEFIATFGNILIDGYEPSALSLGHGILALLKNQDQLLYLQENRNTLPGAVHEILRYENAFPYSARRAVEESSIHGQKIAINDRILFILLAGNRDEETFKEPHNFDINRINAKDHVGFGAGHHACIGRGLAQTTLHAGISSFVTFSLNRKINYDKPEYRKALGFRGFDKLQIRWES